MKIDINYLKNKNEILSRLPFVSNFLHIFRENYCNNIAFWTLFEHQLVRFIFYARFLFSLLLYSIFLFSNRRKTLNFRKQIN